MMFMVMMVVKNKTRELNSLLREVSRLYLKNKCQQFLGNTLHSLTLTMPKPANALTRGYKVRSEKSLDLLVSH